MKVDVTVKPAITFSRPQRMCPIPQSVYGFNDIAPDGKRFLVTLSAVDSTAAVSQLNVVAGWFTELGKKFGSEQQ
jgi:hypothetical protein